MKTLQIRMKIFWISTLYLISGPAWCSDVVVYSGGSVILFPGLQWDVTYTRSVCKMEQSVCVNIIKDETKNNAVTSGRFKMYSNADGEFSLLIRELNLQDSGVYRFGVGTERHKDVELTVQNDACCGRINKMKAYLGETVTFTCNYPDEFKTNSKRLTYINDENRIKDIIYSSKDSQLEQKDRFSIFDDRRSKVFSVNISDVREDDGGVYLCGVWKKPKTVGYVSFFKEFQLRITEEKSTAPPESVSTTLELTTPTSYWTTSASHFSRSSVVHVELEGSWFGGYHSAAASEALTCNIASQGSFLTIYVCVFGALLLIGVAALTVYKLRTHKRQDSASTDQRTDEHTTGDDDDDDDDDYENVSYEDLYNVSMEPIHKSLDANPNRSDLVYENFDSNINQSDDIYENVTITSG